MRTLHTIAFLPFIASSGWAGDDFFSSKIEPVLNRNCYECHSHAEKMKGGLTLDSRSGWEQGGDSGPSLVPGKPEDSLLVKMVRWTDEDHQMPPKKKLRAEELALLEEWVKRGAHDPRVVPKVKRPDATNWWSLKPLVRPDVPVVSGADHPIDRFIRARLAEKKINPSPEADRRTLIRRAYFDLHGLPPSFATVEAFVKDDDTNAYEHLVDELLESPRYGERWARHWLDTIHFAETHGCSHDLPRAHAWRFRDYVIESLNQDKAWSRFIREQLAADSFFPNEPRLTVALGYLGAGLFDHSAYATATTNFDYLDRDDLVTQTMGAFVSTTANCARCHAHKFDPITQSDYYALQAVFSGIIEGNVSYFEDQEIWNQWKRWKNLISAAKNSDKEILLAKENAPLVKEWVEGKQVGWQALKYDSLVSTGGASLDTLNEGIVAVSGDRPAKDVYKIAATTGLRTISAIRLEVISDNSLPKGGPGRQDNGNFTLTGFEASTLKKVKISRAISDFDQKAWEVEKSLDGKSTSGWGIHPKEGESHYALFFPEKPIKLKPGEKLTITLKQEVGSSHLIGRFRLSVSDAPAERLEQFAGLSPLASAALQIASEKRSEEQNLVLAVTALRIRAEQELKQLPKPQEVYAASKRADVLLAVGKGTPKEVAKPKTVHILKRGEFDKPKGEAVSGSLSAVESIPSRFEKAHGGAESDRRAALADWLADKKNPLTWRSIANRVWHYHFGKGICDTPNDFGRMGGEPSHPELLDWLACEFRDSNGSLKHLHRLIMTSAVFRQRSDHRENPAKLDGDNRLLWRMNRLRLDADSFRDFVIVAADSFDDKMHGPSIKQFVTGPPVQLTPTLDYGAYDWAALPKHRRSIYRFVWRGVPDPFLDALDFPDLGMLAPARGFSASSLQSLALFNNAFVLHFSEKIGKEASSPDEVVRRIFMREPTDEEIGSFADFDKQNGLAALSRVLLNSNEFLFVD